MVLSRATELKAWLGSKPPRSWALRYWPIVTALVLLFILLSIGLSWEFEGTSQATTGAPPATLAIGPTVKVPAPGNLAGTAGSDSSSFAEFSFNGRSVTEARGDFDGDGRLEILLIHRSERRLSKSSVLVCYSLGGEELWSFEYGRELHWNERYFAKTFAGRYVESIQLNGENLLLTVADHQPNFPAQVTLLDPSDGSVVDEYFHPGQFKSVLIADVDRDGSDEVLLGGVNNPGEEPGTAVLVVLDLPFRAAGETHSNFFGIPGPLETEYLMFPGWDVCGVMGVTAAVTDLGKAGDLLKVELNAESCGTVFYDCKLPSFEVVEARFADGMKQHHLGLEIADLLDHSLSSAEEEDLLKVVRVETAPNGNSR